MITKEELRTYISMASIIFVLAVLAGYMTAIRFPSESAVIVAGFFKDLDFTQGFDPLSIFIFIFLNNAIKSFLIIILGFFFAVIPVLFIYTNGELIGLITGVFQEENGLWRIVLTILPHGIFEVPAMILATGYGIWLGRCFYRKLRYGENFGEKFAYAMKKFLKVILPLILVAALVESFITPIIVRYIFSR